MRATLNDFKVIFLWSIIAYLLVTIVGSFLFYLTGFSVLLILLLILVIAGGAVLYGFCSFKAVSWLKGKTKLFWWEIAILFAGFLWVYGIALSFVLGSVRGSGNIVGIVASFIGAYISHKNTVSFKKKAK